LAKEDIPNERTLLGEGVEGGNESLINRRARATPRGLSKIRISRKSSERVGLRRILLFQEGEKFVGKKFLGGIGSSLYLWRSKRE